MDESIIRGLRTEDTDADDDLSYYSAMEVGAEGRNYEANSNDQKNGNNYTFGNDDVLSNCKSDMGKSITLNKTEDPENENRHSRAERQILSPARNTNSIDGNRIHSPDTGVSRGFATDELMSGKSVGATPTSPVEKEAVKGIRCSRGSQLNKVLLGGVYRLTSSEDSDDDDGMLSSDQNTPHTTFLDERAGDRVNRSGSHFGDDEKLSGTIIPPMTATSRGSGSEDFSPSGMRVGTNLSHDLQSPLHGTLLTPMSPHSTGTATAASPSSLFNSRQQYETSFARKQEDTPIHYVEGGGNEVKVKRYKVWKGQNKFLCGGRVVFGVHSTQLIQTTCMITFTWIFYVAVIAPFTAQNQSVNTLIALVFLVLNMSLLIATATTDPGIVPRKPLPRSLLLSLSVQGGAGGGPVEYHEARRRYEDLQRALAAKKGLQFCATCKIARPPRARHCKHCDNCVMVFDHHCPVSME
jgi:hypothetical protein